MVQALELEREREKQQKATVAEEEKEEAEEHPLNRTYIVGPRRDSEPPLPEAPPLHHCASCEFFVL